MGKLADLEGLDIQAATRRVLARLEITGSASADELLAALGGPTPYTKEHGRSKVATHVCYIRRAIEGRGYTVVKRYGGGLYVLCVAEEAEEQKRPSGMSGAQGDALLAFEAAPERILSAEEICVALGSKSADRLGVVRTQLSLMRDRLHDAGRTIESVGGGRYQLVDLPAQKRRAA